MMYFLYITSKYTSRDSAMQFLTASYGVSANIAIGALLLFKS